MFEQRKTCIFCDCRTSMYDSRARERRRQIEEQEALAAQLLRQVSVHHCSPLHIQFCHIRCSSASFYPTNLCRAVTGSQRLSEEGQRSPDVEVHVRVPLEKEVPLTLVIEEPKPVEEKPEFPELTEVSSLYLHVHAVFTIFRIYLDDLSKLHYMMYFWFPISSF